MSPRGVHMVREIAPPLCYFNELSSGKNAFSGLQPRTWQGQSRLEQFRMFGCTAIAPWPDMRRAGKGITIVGDGPGYKDPWTSLCMGHDPSGWYVMESALVRRSLCPGPWCCFPNWRGADPGAFLPRHGIDAAKSAAARGGVPGVCVHRTQGHRCQYVDSPACKAVASCTLRVQRRVHHVADARAPCAGV